MTSPIAKNSEKKTQVTLCDVDHRPAPAWPHVPASWHGILTEPPGSSLFPFPSPPSLERRPSICSSASLALHCTCTISCSAPPHPPRTTIPFSGTGGVQLGGLEPAIFLSESFVLPCRC